MYKVFGVKGACCKMCFVKKLSGVIGVVILGSCINKGFKKLSGVKVVGCKRCLV